MAGPEMSDGATANISQDADIERLHDHSEWSSRLMPNGSITCIEIAPIRVNYASQRLKKASQFKYPIIEISITETDFADDDFDSAIAGIVFAQIPGPVEALKVVVNGLR